MIDLSVLALVTAASVAANVVGKLVKQHFSKTPSNVDITLSSGEQVRVQMSAAEFKASVASGHATQMVEKAMRDAVSR